jgi:hypothetical protein
MDKIKDILEAAQNEYDSIINNGNKLSEKIKSDARRNGLNIINKSKIISKTLINNSTLKSKNLINEAIQTWDRYKEDQLNSITNIFDNNINKIKNNILHDTELFFDQINTLEMFYDVTISEIADSLSSIDKSIKKSNRIISSVFTEYITISSVLIKRIYQNTENTIKKSSDNITNVIFNLKKSIHYNLLSFIKNINIKIHNIIDNLTYIVKRINSDALHIVLSQYQNIIQSLKNNILYATSKFIQIFGKNIWCRLIHCNFWYRIWKNIKILTVRTVSFFTSNTNI